MVMIGSLSTSLVRNSYEVDVTHSKYFCDDGGEIFFLDESNPIFDRFRIYPLRHSMRPSFWKIEDPDKPPDNVGAQHRSRV